MIGRYVFCNAARKDSLPYTGSGRLLGLTTVAPNPNEPSGVEFRETGQPLKPEVAKRLREFLSTPPPTPPAEGKE